MDVTERFLKYVSFDTTSSEESDTCPTTPASGYWARSWSRKCLRWALRMRASMNMAMYTAAFRPARAVKTSPRGSDCAYGYLSGHAGGNIKPRIIKNYDGAILCSMRH